MTVLTVHSVFGEGEKLLLDIPVNMRKALTIRPGMQLNLEEILLWNNIAQKSNAHFDEEEFQDFVNSTKRWCRLAFGHAVNEEKRKR